MQVQPIYFSNGLLATSKIFVSDGPGHPGHAKKSNFFLLGWGRRNRSQPKYVENNYLAVANTQRLFHFRSHLPILCLAREL